MTEKKIITINAGEIEVQAELNDSETAAAIHEILPVEGTANLWGEEIYFEIDLALEPEADAREAGAGPAVYPA